MFIVKLVVARPRAVVAVFVGLILLGGLVGIGVIERLNLAGYDDPNSQSAHAEELIENAFGRQTPDIVAIYAVPAGETPDSIGGRVTARLNAVDPALLEKPIESYWNADSLRRMAMVSTDHGKVIAAVSLKGSISDRMKHYADVADLLKVDGVDTRFSGYIPLTDAYNTKSRTGIVIGEAVAVPVMLVLLVLIFGGVIAASMPLVVGGLAVIGTLGALRVISTFTDVSMFALNIASIIGLGLAIDYSLFVVSRYREELAVGRTPAEAVRTTILTAGRTVGFSAILLICAFAGMLVFPIAMLQSLGYAAMSSIAIAAAAATIALPAALLLLGGRLDALSLRRGALERDQQRAQQRWASIADWVMRRPVAVTVVIAAVLVGLSLPLLGIKLGGINPTVLPAGDSVRQASATLAAEFPNTANGATLVIQGNDGAAPSETAVASVIVHTQQVDGVRQVIRLGAKDDLVLVRALLKGADFSADSEVTVRALKDLPALDGASVYVGGVNALRADSYDSIVDRIPAALAIVVAVTLLVMAFAFRSIVLPIKAVLMALLSLSATFGILTLIFVDGWGASLLGAEPAPLPLPALVVVVVAVFGLSTDYEVFLMSRMVEARATGADTGEAVRVGVSRTGRIITAAAGLFVIVTAAAAVSEVTLIKAAALGMAIAVLIDATVVRMLLVPALVKLMGEMNWWTPFGRQRQPEAEILSGPEPVEA